MVTEEDEVIFSVSEKSGNLKSKFRQSRKKGIEYFKDTVVIIEGRMAVEDFNRLW